MIRFAILMAFVVISLPAQITPLGSVGSGQVVPDPVFPTGPAGQLTLSGSWCPTLGLRFEMVGVPDGYNASAPLTTESIVLAINAGQSAAPGVGIAGGQFYIPLTNVVLGAGAPSTYLGPGDIVSCPGSILLPGSPGVNNRNGRLWSFGALPPGTLGLLTVQAYMVDPQINRIYTANALNFSIP